jgi:hypothetical protein
VEYALGIFLLVVPALFAIVNPPGAAFIFNEVTAHLTAAQRRTLSDKVALYSLGVMLGALWGGAYVLEFFGISLASFQVGGGCLLLISSLAMLNAQPAESKASDVDEGNEKVDAGASFVVTQLFVDNAAYFEFVAQARRLGITVPIVPGVMPITNVDQVERFTRMCGASIPEPLVKELDRRRDEPERVQELGIVHATIQALGLIQGGAPGVHFYTLNKSSATREILTALRMNARV